MAQFGAIGSEIKAALGAMAFIEEEDGGVLLPGVTRVHERSLSLKELVASSEPLYDTPRSGRTAFSMPSYTGPLTPTMTHLKMWQFVSPPSPAPRRFDSPFASSPLTSPVNDQVTGSVEDPSPRLVRYLGDGALQDFELPMKVENGRARTNTIISNVSDFGQKSYKELLNYASDKIERIMRKHVNIANDARNDPYTRYNMTTLIDLASKHMGYPRIAESWVRHNQNQHANLVIGLIWHIVVDSILAVPLLDQAPSQYAGRFLEAWRKENTCGAIADGDWSIKGPLLQQRAREVRRVIETTPKFNDFIKSFAFDRTNDILNKLEAAFPPGKKSQICFQLLEPIEKLVRMAIRMRGEMKAFEFKFYDHASKVESEQVVCHAEFLHKAPPREYDHVFNHVLVTKVPQVLEKEFRTEAYGKECIYKAEVIIKEKWTGYNHPANLGEHYRPNRRPSPRR